MAKGKGKRSSGANETVTDGAAPVSESQATPSVPEFDAGAFAGLRQKIEQRLNASSAKGKSKQNDKTKPSADKPPTNKAKEAAPKPGKNQESGQGKKRDRNGEVISHEDKKGAKGKQEQSKKKGGKDDEALRQEILALGGTEDDLDLVAGVDSESEVEGEASKAKSKGGDEDLRKELSKMLEAAGHVVPDDLEDDEVEEEEEAPENDIEDVEEEPGSEEGFEVDSEPEDVSEVSDIEEAPKANKASAAKSKESEVVVPKEYAKLVSFKCSCPEYLKLTVISPRPFFLDPTGTPFLLLQWPARNK